MSGMQRHRISDDKAASAARPQNLSCAVQEMRWQGTDKRGRQLRWPYFFKGLGRTVASDTVPMFARFICDHEGIRTPWFGELVRVPRAFGVVHSADT
jgi:hypothetical protein